jgi:hypothetical protein
MDTHENAMPNFNQYGATKQFFLHTLEHLTKNNIITPYTRDKLTDMVTSEAKKDFAKARKHVLDMMSLHDTFDESIANFKAVTNDGSNSSANNSTEKQKQRRKQGINGA